MTDESGTRPAERVGTSLLTEVAMPLVAESLRPLQADAGFVATVGPDGETLDVARVTPYSASPVRLGFPRDAPYPLAETIRTQRPLLIESNDDLCEHPGLVRVKNEDHACATVPLFADNGDLLGAVNFGFDEPRRFTSEELELIDLVAEHCSRAMSLARSLRAEVRSRATPGGPLAA